MHAAAEAFFCRSLVRIDWHWRTSRSSPTILLCFNVLSDFEHYHSFLSQHYLLKLVSYPRFTCFCLSFLYLYVRCLCAFSLLLSFFHSIFPILFLPWTMSSWYYSTPLQESQRMQTKLDALTREVFDLQETINWKDKKIGVGGPTRVLWQNVRGKRWLDIRLIHLFCLSCCLYIIVTRRH